METLPLFHIQILHLLALRYGAGCTLEELAGLITPMRNAAVSAQDMRTQTQQQAEVLDALLLLNDNGHIFLNPYTDKSTITIKGLIRIRSRILSN